MFIFDITASDVFQTFSCSCIFGAFFPEEEKKKSYILMFSTFWSTLAQTFQTTVQASGAQKGSRWSVKKKKKAEMKDFLFFFLGLCFSSLLYIIEDALDTKSVFLLDN